MSCLSGLRIKMAGVQGRSDIAPAKVCKKCKKVPQNGLKCISCGTISHAGCLKRIDSVKFLDGNTVLCCNDYSGEENMASDKVDKVNIANSSLSSTIDNSQEEVGKIKIMYLEQLLKQKDTLIATLEDKINILKDHINLLKNVNNIAPSNQPPNQLNPSSFHKNKETYRNSYQKEFNTTNNKNEHGTAAQVEQTPLNHSNNSLTKVSTSKNNITTQQVAYEVMKAETMNCLDKYINITKDSHPAKNTDKELTKSKGIKQPRKLIIGKSTSNSTIKGVPKYAILHVYRLDRNTTTTIMGDALRQHFPEVEVEELTPKHPELYTSFKVKIYESHFKTAMNPDIWPLGACVSRFLEMRKKSTPPIV